MTEKSDGDMDGSLPKGLSESNYAVASSGPAILSNRFYVTLSQSGTRIAFCESIPGVDEQFRTAVVLNFNDALELANLLKSLISANVVFSGTESPKAEGE
jgi:hypothetical protein